MFNGRTGWPRQFRAREGASSSKARAYFFPKNARRNSIGNYARIGGLIRRARDAVSCINNVGVIATPELHASGGSFRGCGPTSEVVDLQRERPPAIVMQGWRPRTVEARRSSFERIGAAVMLIRFSPNLRKGNDKSSHS